MVHRYKMRILVRPNDEEGHGEESVIKFHVTANSEFAARRLALEAAWANGFLVSRFLEIRERNEI